MMHVDRSSVNIQGNNHVCSELYSAPLSLPFWTRLPIFMELTSSLSMLLLLKKTKKHSSASRTRDIEGSDKYENIWREINE